MQECKSYLPINLKSIPGANRYLQFVDSEDKSTHFCREYKTLYKIGFGVYVWDYYIIFGVPDNYVTFQSGVIWLSFAEYYQKIKFKKKHMLSLLGNQFDTRDSVIEYLKKQKLEQGIYSVVWETGEEFIYIEVI